MYTASFISLSARLRSAVVLTLPFRIKETMTSNFDNLIHQLMNAPRPKVGNEDDIKTIVTKLVDSTGESQGDD
jgi:hypothetical protein